MKDRKSGVTTLGNQRFINLPLWNKSSSNSSTCFQSPLPAYVLHPFWRHYFLPLSRIKILPISLIPVLFPELLFLSEFFFLLLFFCLERSFFFPVLPLSKIMAKYIKITLGHFVIAFKKIWEKWKIVRYHDWIAFNGIKIVSRWKRFISLDLKETAELLFFPSFFFFIIIIWVICSMFSLYFMSHCHPLVFFSHSFI